ncbi:MAG: GNAT family N-acetyltransferase, partial [Deltaproteobacteria bacterium]|nr:GNAT family N-acetyltransferase [Deltaproteobacteria bacterium]
YVRSQLSQDAARGFATAVVGFATAEPEHVVGYYTLCAASVTLTELPEGLRRKLPRYQAVPAIRLGRLAVASAWQNRHVGTLLLIDALKRAYNYELAWALFLVDAKNEHVERFYKKFFFKPFLDRPQSLWMHRKQLKRLISA